MRGAYVGGSIAVSEVPIIVFCIGAIVFKLYGQRCGTSSDNVGVKIGYDIAVVGIANAYGVPSVGSSDYLWRTCAE